MSYRFMRLLVMFDMPTFTSGDLREYRRFRKFLIKSGFYMFQESVYTKIALNTTTVKSITESIRKNKPKDGFVTLLKITEKQFAEMEMIIGECSTDVVSSDSRVVII